MSLTPRDTEEVNAALGIEDSFKVYVRVRPLNERELYSTKSNLSIV